MKKFSAAAAVLAAGLALTAACRAECPEGWKEETVSGKLIRIWDQTSSEQMETDYEIHGADGSNVAFYASGPFFGLAPDESSHANAKLEEKLKPFLDKDVRATGCLSRERGQVYNVSKLETS